MRFRADCLLLCPSQADAEQVRGGLDTRLGQRQWFAVDLPPLVAQTMAGQWTVRCEARGQVRADAEDVYAWVQSAWSSGGLRNRISSGSRVRFHACPHDEDPSAWVPCDSVEITEVVKP